MPGPVGFSQTEMRFSGCLRGQDSEPDESRVVPQELKRFDERVSLMKICLNGDFVVEAA